MIEVGHFWFVPANIRTYSALVTDMIPMHEAPCIGGLRMIPRNKRAFWDPLASRDPRWLRRSGWPISISGRAFDDFPGGSVVFDLAAKRVLLTVDPVLSSSEFVQELSAHFGFLRQTVTIQECRGSGTISVAPPKPWY